MAIHNPIDILKITCQSTPAMSKTHIKAFEAGLVSIITNELPPKNSFRNLRGCIISVKAIQSIVKQVNGCLLVDSNPSADFKMTVSRSRVDDFMQWVAR